MPLFDKKDKSRYATFTRRSVGMGAGMTAVFAVLAGRLYQLQIRDGDQYMVEAEDNRVSERLIAPPRGRIMDRFGVELANSRRNYRVLLVSEQATEGVPAALDTIGKVILLSDQQKKKIIHDIAMNKKFVPVPVAENLSWEEFSLVNLHLPYLPGVQCDVGESRDYPFGKELVHTLGYVSSVSPQDIEHDDDPLMNLPGMRIGKRGIEKQFDREIRGRAGASRVEVNAYGRIIRDLSKDAGEPGEDVYLTLDRQVQALADQKLEGQSAALVVMDVTNGDVIAMSSTPGFDPNLFNVGLSGPQWHDLTTDDHKPLLNKFMGGIYPPGSTFKTAVALAAIDAGIATPDYHVSCNGVFNFGGHAFHCWQHKGHGTLDVVGGIQHSCDVFFYETARRVGIDRLAAMARRFGFGGVLGIDIPGERPGLIPSRDWKLATTGTAWSQGETLIAGIGQGSVLATPLQLATMVARLVTGRAVSPRLVRADGLMPTGGDPAPPDFPSLGINPRALALVLDGMNAVVNEQGGTAYAARITEPGFAMGGKSGTSQVRHISEFEREHGVRKARQIPWKERDHALFLAFAPVSAPRYVCATVVEHGGASGGGGSAVAAPICRDVLLETQRRDPARRVPDHDTVAQFVTPVPPRFVAPAG